MASIAATQQPVPYSSALEKPEDGEAESTNGLIETMRKINDITFKDMGHSIRSVHAKSHGLLLGRLQVMSGLPPTLAQGLFAQAGSYPVVMRFSTVPGDILDDNVSTPRGLAIKIVGVQGARLPGSEADVTQDFVLINGPAFLVPTAKKFLGNVKLLAATTDKAPGLKKVLSAALRGAEKLLESVGGESGTIKALGGQPETNILGETYYSQVPLLYGTYMAKVALAPISPELVALKDVPVDLDGKPNGLRGATVDFFSQHAGEWELRVQLCTDIDSMPIENAATVWPEDKSPYVAVARITVLPQLAWSEARSQRVDDQMSFSPWHGLAAHRPIGSLMRVRKAVYEAAAQFRRERNGKTIEEPRSLETLPS